MDHLIHSHTFIQTHTRLLTSGLKWKTAQYVHYTAYNFFKWHANWMHYSRGGLYTRRKLSVSIHVHLNSSCCCKYHILAAAFEETYIEVGEHAICICYLICVIEIDGFIAKREKIRLLEILVCLPPQGSSGWDWLSGVSDSHVSEDPWLWEITLPVQSSTYYAHRCISLVLSRSYRDGDPGTGHSDVQFLKNIPV